MSLVKKAAIIFAVIGCSASFALTPSSYKVSISVSNLTGEKQTIVFTDLDGGAYQTAIFMNEAIADYFQALPAGRHLCTGKVLVEQGQIFDIPECK